jgi:hypothetical protein
MPTSNAVHPGQSLYATRSGALAGAAWTDAALAAGALAAAAVGWLSSVSLWQPKASATNATVARCLTMANSLTATRFGVVSSRLRRDEIGGCDRANAIRTVSASNATCPANCRRLQC